MMDYLLREGAVWATWLAGALAVLGLVRLLRGRRQ